MPDDDVLLKELTLRDFFAARAPAVPEWWPDPELPPHVYCRPPFSDDADKMNLWTQWLDYPDETALPAEVLTAFREYKAAYDQGRADREYGVTIAWMRREVEWAYAYADAMLAARKETHQ